ncbi:hypothetical protein VPH35_019685 [Triticum aestivum]
MHRRSPSPAPPLEPTGERLEVEEIPACLSTGSGSAPVTLPPSVGGSLSLWPFVQIRHGGQTWRRFVLAERPCGGRSTAWLIGGSSDSGIAVSFPVHEAHILEHDGPANLWPLLLPPRRCCGTNAGFHYP